MNKAEKFEEALKAIGANILKDEAITKAMYYQAAEIAMQSFADQENKELRSELDGLKSIIEDLENIIETNETVIEQFEHEEKQTQSRIEELKLKFSESAYKAIELAQPFDIDRQNDAKQMIEQTLTQEKE